MLSKDMERKIARNLRLIVIIYILIVGLLFVGLLGPDSFNVLSVNIPSKECDDREVVEFTGDLESYSDLCISDDSCFIVVGGKRIVVDQNFLKDNFSNIQDDIGKVYYIKALRIGDELYSLVGDPILRIDQR